MSRWIHRFAWLVLALAGTATWGVSTGWLNPIQPPDLSQLPAELGGFRILETYSVDSGLLGDLPPDRFRFSRIEDDVGRSGQLYVAYFERGRRWSGRPHDLATCYRAGGWEAGPDRVMSTDSGASLTVQDFRMEERQIRVFHWIQQPGLEPGELSPAAMVQRMFGPFSLRQDMASIYLEFPLEHSPSDLEAVRAAQALMDGLAQLWR